MKIELPLICSKCNKVIIDKNSKVYDGFISESGNVFICESCYEKGSID